MLAGILTDVFGSYTNSFVVLAVLAGLGSVFFVFSVPPKVPEEEFKN